MVDPAGRVALPARLDEDVLGADQRGAADRRRPVPRAIADQRAADRPSPRRPRPGSTRTTGGGGPSNTDVARALDAEVPVAHPDGGVALEHEDQPLHARPPARRTDWPGLEPVDVEGGPVPAGRCRDRPRTPGRRDRVRPRGGGGAARPPVGRVSAGWIPRDGGGGHRCCSSAIARPGHRSGGGRSPAAIDRRRCLVRRPDRRPRRQSITWVSWRTAARIVKGFRASARRSGAGPGRRGAAAPDPAAAVRRGGPCRRGPHPARVLAWK